MHIDEKEIVILQREFVLRWFDRSRKGQKGERQRLNRFSLKLVNCLNAGRGRNMIENLYGQGVKKNQKFFLQCNYQPDVMVGQL